MSDKRGWLVLTGLLLATASPAWALQITPPLESRRTEGVPGRLRLSLAVAGVYDSNIGHDTDEIQSIGSVTTGELQYAKSGGGIRYWLDGGAAWHRYSQTDRFDRVGAFAAARFELPVAGPLNIGLNTEASLNGADEDRTLTDQIAISPRLIFRFQQGGQLRIYGAQRFRRSDFNNATSDNRYLAAALRTPGGNRPYLELGSRYEINETDLARNRFDRWLHSVRLTVPLGAATEIAARLQYTAQDFPDRPLENSSAFRQDKKWTPQLTFEQEAFNNLDIGIEYEFERRTSNEADEFYNAHNLTIISRYRW